MAEIAVEDLAGGLADPSFNSADAAGDECENDGRTVLYFKSTAAGDAVVTVDSKKLSNFGQDVDPEYTIPAGGEFVTPPFDRERFSSLLEWSYDDETNITVAALRVPGVVPT